MKQDAHEILIDGIKLVQQKKDIKVAVKKTGKAIVNVDCMKRLLVQINIVVEAETSTV